MSPLSREEIQKLREENPELFNVYVSEQVHHISEHDCDCGPKRYGSDANADLESHRKMSLAVFRISESYYNCLHDLLCDRLYLSKKQTGIEALGAYRIGDYSQAALTVLQPKAEGDL